MDLPNQFQENWLGSRVAEPEGWNTHPSTVIHLLESQVNCRLPDTLPSERLDDLPVPKER